eukprot:717484-Amphidinium_carterae.3
MGKHYLSIRLAYTSSLMSFRASHSQAKCGKLLQMRQSPKKTLAAAIVSSVLSVGQRRCAQSTRRLEGKFTNSKLLGESMSGVN